ncbi:MAG: glycosyl hydrolase, partial [Acidobacteriota bacterium]
AREHDLIIATHGRGIYILDDLTPMRALTQEIVESSFALLPSRDSVMFLSADLQDFPGDDLFIASNPPEAASIFFYQKRRHIFGDLKIEIYDSEGAVVSTIQAPKIRGLNRAEWPMRMPAPKLPPATNLSRAMTGPRVPEGEYRFKVFKGKETFEGTLRLVPDPRSTHSAEDRAIQQRTALKLYEMLEDLTYYVDASIDLRTQAEKILEGRGEEDALVPLAKQLIDEIEEYRGGLVSTAAAGMLSGDEKLREKLGEIFSGISSYDGRPTQSQLDRTEVLGGQLETAAQDFRAMLSGDSLRALNEQLEAAETSPLTPLGREAWQAQSGESGAGGPGFSLRQVENGFRSPWF